MDWCLGDMDAPNERRVRIIKRVFPIDRPQTITATQLSILDASVSRFSSCGAIWFYDRTDGTNANDPVVFERLESGLSSLLDGPLPRPYRMLQTEY